MSLLPIESPQLDFDAEVTDEKPEPLEGYYEPESADDPLLPHDIAIRTIGGVVADCLPEYEPDSLTVIVPINEPPEIIAGADNNHVFVGTW